MTSDIYIYLLFGIYSVVFILAAYLVHRTLRRGNNVDQDLQAFNVLQKYFAIIAAGSFVLGYATVLMDGMGGILLGTLVFVTLPILGFWVLTVILIAVRSIGKNLK